MKKTLLITLTVLISYFTNSFAQETFNTSNTIQEVDSNQSYKYLHFGLGPIIFIPQAGLGYRSHNSDFGFDASLSAASIVHAHYLTASLNGLYYFKNSINNPYYAGCGAVGGCLFANLREDKLYLVSPNFIVGKEFTDECGKKSFIEANVAVPTFNVREIKSDHFNFPLVNIRYGIAF